MAEKSSLQYKNLIIALYRIQETAQENVHLWKPKYIPNNILYLFSVVRHEEPEDVDKVYYGITPNGELGRLIFCFANGRYNNPFEEEGKGDKISVRELTDEIEIHNQRGAGVTPVYLLHSFLGAIEEPLRRYEMAEAGIEGKIRGKMRSLEKELRHRF